MPDRQMAGGSRKEPPPLPPIIFPTRGVAPRRPGYFYRQMSALMIAFLHLAFSCQDRATAGTSWDSKRAWLCEPRLL